MLLSRTSRTALLILLCLAATAREAISAEPESLQLDGKVFAVRRGVIAVLSSGYEQPWLVKVPEEPSAVVVTGKGGPELISSGAWVEFSVDLDIRRQGHGGQGHGEVASVLIFSPIPGYVPGVYDEADDHEEKTENLEEQEGSGKKRKSAAKKPLKTKRYSVSGQVRGMKKGKLTVFTGPAGIVKVRVAEKAEITITASDYSMARQGDEISAYGTYVQPGQLTASTIEIKLAKRDPKAKKKGRRSSKPKKMPKKKSSRSGKAVPNTDDPFGVQGGK